MVKHSTILNELIQCDIHSLEDVSNLTFDEMNRRSRMTNLSSQSSDDLIEETESDDDDDDDSVGDDTHDQRTDADSSDPQNDDSTEFDEINF